MKQFIFLFVYIFSISSISFADDFWQRTGPRGPNGWDNLFVDASGKLYLYADTIIVSSDNGNTWSGISTQGNYFAAFYANSPTDIFAADYSNLKHTTDGGATWNTVEVGISPINVHTITKKSNGNYFIGTNNLVFRSTDGATNNWKRLTSGFSDGNVYALTYANDGSVIAGGWTNIYRSTNNGDTWTSVLSSPTVRKFAVSSTGVILGGTAELGAYTSSDNGVTWQFSSGLPDSNITAVGSDVNGNLFVSTQKNGPYKSTNNGSSWISISAGLSYKFINDFGFSSGNLIAISRAAFKSVK